MANNTIFDYDQAATIDGATHWLLIQPGNNSVDYNRIDRQTLLGVTGQPADISTSQNFTNKVLNNTNTLTVKDSLFTIQDNLDTTKQAQFQLSGLTTATTRTYTLPNRSDTLVDLGSTQTLTSKTLTSPAITGGTIDNTTVTVDSIGGHTSATSGTVYGITVTTGTIAAAGIASNAVTTAKIQNAAVTASKLATGAAQGVVLTSETTASTSFVDLSTTTDTVTVTVGANGLLQVAIFSWLSNSGANSSAVSFALSGTNTLAASDDYSLFLIGTSQAGQGLTTLLTGLNAGSTTVKMKYKVSAGTGTFVKRRVSAVPL